MGIKNLQKNWEGFARKDPLWAICTRPDKMKNKWTLKEFFLTGEQEIGMVWNHIRSLGQKVDKRRALDFGCCVGRLTQALSKRFSSCVGVDISPTMIKLADKLNPQSKKCRYLVNESDSLSVFKDSYFGFIYSSIVFQHMKPGYTKNYVKEFMRILKPDGLMVFQIPERYKGRRSFMSLLNPKALLGKLLVALGIGYEMEMHYMAEKDVRTLVFPARVLDVKLVGYGGKFSFLKREPEEGYVIKQYYVKK